MTNQDKHLSAALERLKQVEEERAKLLNEAKEELLARANAAIAELNTLGFSYHLIEGSVEPARKARERHKDPTAPCPVCKFVTRPVHDARAHKSQGEHKKPFTAQELKDKDWKKVQ